MAGNTPESTNIYLYDMAIAKWKEVTEEADSPVVIVADVYWGRREGAYSHPAGLNACYMNPAYQDFGRSYFHTEAHQRLVWCPTHRCFEKIHHLERMDSIRSASGCRLQGKIAYFSINVDLSYKENTAKTITAPIGWELKRMADGSVDVQAELFQLPVNINFTDFGISLDVENIESCRVTISENFRVGEGTVNFAPSGKDWTDFGLDIPGIVTEQAITYLLLAADDAYIPPESNTKGYRRLRAFSRCPKDLHIEYWRGIIDQNFDGLFPQKQKNPFLALCKYLKIPVTAKLTEGYEKNPFAPLWAVILRRWGFREEENIERFYGLEEFAGISPNCFSEFCGSDVGEMLSASASKEVENRWYMLDHFVRWALTVTSEADLAGRGLWALASRPWTEEIEEELSKVYCLTDDAYLFPEEQKLSPRVQSHLLGHNLQWLGHHWSAEHFQTMEELNRIEDLWEGRCWGKPGYEIENSPFANLENVEDEGKGDLTRTLRLLAAYDSMLLGNEICCSVYPLPSMLGRDMKLLRKFEPTISYRPRDGRYEIENVMERYREETDVEPLLDQSRKTRLLAYIRFLHDCGYLSRGIADKLNGALLPRRTFVRDLSILRRAFPEKELVYHAKDKCYVWEEVDGNESH